MKKKSILLGILCSFFIMQGIFAITIPTAKADLTIPPDFYSELDTDSLYVYNVTKFGGDLIWYGFDPITNYNTTTNAGGQISVNFTGFYDKDPLDMYNAFGSPMPYMDIEFIENQAGVLNSNHTFYNVSNGEAAFNLALGYNAFQSGFLIPNDNLTYLKDLALAQDSMPGYIDVEESSNFISFDFKQDSKFQNTTVVYEKKSGLLVWARTKMAPITDPIGYTLEFFLTNYSLDFDSVYTYNVSRFGKAAFWYDWNYNYVDTWTTNPGGLVIVNFTDYYFKDSNEPTWNTDAFPSDLKRAWLDLEIYYDGYLGPIGPQISLTNISNREAAIQMSMGYFDLQSGFLIPMIDNLTFIREKALNAANPGEVEISETELTISIFFDQIGGFQTTHLIYEKKTGLLQWIDTLVGSFNLEMTLIGFTPPDNTTPPPNDSIPSYIPLILGLGILITSTLIIKKVKRQIKKV